MRGYVAAKMRAGAKPYPVNEATARPYSHPAPYNGWNAKGNLANMSPVEAITLDNLFPGERYVILRKGYIDWSTAYPANIKSLLPYSGAVDRLFASTNANIYNATSSGAVGASVATCTNGFWYYTNFANTAGRWLCLCNGTDAYKTYDGTTWATPAITNVSGADLIAITAHQKRLWFVEENTMNLWYLATEAVSGAATQFPVGALFKRGGYLVAIGSWTIDSGAGSNDLFVIATSNGEIAIYQGTDPASSATWALVGVYQVAKPLGKRPLLEYGGDLLYLSRIGLIPLTQITQSTILDKSKPISERIDGAFSDAAADYSTNVDWQMITHHSQNMLIINVPVSADTLSYQFVMNTHTKAWCRFTNWNASCWAALGNDIYFAGGTKVVKAWTGLLDGTNAIVGQVAQAYSGLGYGGQKEISLVRPNIALSSSATIQMSLDADFRTFNGQTTITYVPISVGAVWDLSLWDSGIWDAGAQVLDPKWTTVPAELGYLHSFRMTITTSTSEGTWTSTDFAYRPAGIL